MQSHVDAFNAVEAALWIGMAFVVVFFGRQPRRISTYLWSLTLFLFGISDIVELQTGAFWRPWWLLAWKAGCLATFLSLFAHHQRLKRARPEVGGSLAASPNREITE